MPKFLFTKYKSFIFEAAAEPVWRRSANFLDYFNKFCCCSTKFYFFAKGMLNDVRRIIKFPVIKKLSNIWSLKLEFARSRCHKQILL